MFISRTVNVVFFTNNKDEDPCNRDLLPSEVMFTQDSISSLFSNARFKGRSIGDVAVGIINQWGNRHQNQDYNDIRNHIQVARGRGEYANLCFSENNRGLWVLKAIENKINSIQVNHPVEPHKFTKFTTGDIYNNLRHPFSANPNDNFRIKIRGVQRVSEDMDLSADFWYYSNRCLTGKYLPNDIDYSVKEIPVMYVNKNKIRGNPNISKIAENIVNNWRYLGTKQADIFNYNTCVNNMEILYQQNGRRTYCFAKDNQCLWILKTVAKGVQVKYRSNIQISNFKVVDMKTFGQYVNINMLEKDGKDVKLKIPGGFNIIQ